MGLHPLVLLIRDYSRDSRIKKETRQRPVVSDCLERMILPALLSGRCSRIRLRTYPLRVACLFMRLEKIAKANDFEASFCRCWNPPWSLEFSRTRPSQDRALTRSGLLNY